MRTMLRRILVVLVVGAPLAGGQAQIMITEDDVRDQMTVGKAVTNIADTLTKFVDIGTAAASSWDFSAFQNHGSTDLLSVAPGSTPYGSQFPEATIALQTELVVEGIRATAYLYLVLSTDLLNPGAMGGTSTFLGPLELKRVNTPSDVVYALPSTYGTTWTSVYTEEETYTLNANPISATTRTHDVSYVVDAYGPMTIPGGYTEEVLRIRKRDSTATGIRVTYIFLGKTGVSAQVVAAEADPADNGTIQVTSVTWNGPLPTDVSTADGVPQDYVLLQNYPNPFNPSTTLAFALPQQSHVSLKVFNLLGEEVATLVDETMDAGDHTVRFDASGLSSGVYLYRLRAGEFLQSRRMTILR